MGYSHYYYSLEYLLCEQNTLASWSMLAPTLSVNTLSNKLTLLPFHSLLKYFHPAYYIIKLHTTTGTRFPRFVPGICWQCPLMAIFIINVFNKWKSLKSLWILINPTKNKQYYCSLQSSWVEIPEHNVFLNDLCTLGSKVHIHLIKKSIIIRIPSCDGHANQWKRTLILHCEK